jgi:Spy/CpxP family protein refolding chaperone
MRRGILIALGLTIVVPAVLDAQRRPLGPRGQAFGPRMAIGNRAGPAQIGRQGMAFNPQLLIQRREALDLSDEQVTQLEALAAETRSTREALPATIREHADALREAWRAETTDVGAIERHTRAILDAQQQAAMAAVTATARARELLSAEQRGRMEGWVEGRFGRSGRVGVRRGTGRRMPGGARRLRRPN